VILLRFQIEFKGYYKSLVVLIIYYSFWVLLDFPEIFNLGPFKNQKQ